MRSIGSIVDLIVGQSFEIECIKIKIRGQGRHAFEEPYFSGPGSITGDVTGNFRFRLYDTLDRSPKEIVRLSNLAAVRTEPMAIDADDYAGTEWTGAWFIPAIHVSPDTARCFVTGEFPQLSTRVAFTAFERERNATVNYYASVPELPMLKKSHRHHIREDNVELVSIHWDRTDLNFAGADVKIILDEKKNRTRVSTTYRDEWRPPYCEVGLTDAFAFITATNLRPRITVRGFQEDALVFIRYTPEEPRTGMLRPIICNPSAEKAFWDLFLAFLRNCEIQKQFYSTRFSRLFSELVPASTGTIHGIILSLVLAIEDLVDQLSEAVPTPAGIEQLMAHVRTWPGDEALKTRAIGILSSFLGRTSTNENLRKLIQKRIVTEDQRRVWDDLRNRVAIAHGRLVDYDDEKLMEKRNQLITMFYRLSACLLKYRGPLTDYGTWPPVEFDFQWDE
jgi:hypothetical protein